MLFLYILSWLSSILHICLATLSIAAGLYYMAELVEEYPTTAGKIIRNLIWFTTAIYVGLLFLEDLPWTLLIVGLLTNIVYYAVMKTYPVIDLMSPVFLLSLILIVINHYLAFQYFSTVWYPFSEVLAFFTVCLWLVPFTFFISLSANDNVLPTLDQTRKPTGDMDDGDIVSNYFKRKANKYNLISFLKTAQDTILPQRVKKGY